MLMDPYLEMGVWFVMVHKPLILKKNFENNEPFCGLCDSGVPGVVKWPQHTLKMSNLHRVFIWLSFPPTQIWS